MVLIGVGVDVVSTSVDHLFGVVLVLIVLLLVLACMVFRCFLWCEVWFACVLDVCCLGCLVVWC